MGKREVKEKKNKGNEEKKNPLHKEYGSLSNMLFIAKNMAIYDKKLFFWMMLGVLSAPFGAYLWNFMSKFIIDMITQGGHWTNLLIMMVIFALIQIVTTLMSTYQQDTCWPKYIGARMYIMLQMNRKAMTIDFEHLENSDVMDCHQKAQNACNNNQDGVEGMMHQMFNFMQYLVVAVTGFIILGTMNIWVMVLMVVLAIFHFLTTNYCNKIGKKKVWDPLAPWWRKQYYMSETTTSFKEAKDIRMYGLQDWLLDKMKDLYSIRYKAQKLNEKIWCISNLISNILWFLSQVALYGYLVYAVIKGDITIGNFSLYITSAATFYNYVSAVLNAVGNIMARSRQVYDFRSFLDFDGGDDESKGEQLPELSAYEFTFENVSFKYPKAEKYALKNLNLTLHAGERLAVVGLNGAGKSTMIKLLLRLYEPTEGRILLNGLDVKTYNKRSYYKAFAPIFQDVEIFAFPMEENVSMQEPEKTDRDRAKKCLEDAGLADKLAELPNGTKTELLKVIYDDGVDLSGGEKQKLALARALYKAAPVVVLDEPTAALDALAEAKLYEDFDKLIGGKTAVYISHRLSSTQFCNRVAMFVDGEMVELGTHKELLEQGGAYADMFRIQAQYYVENEESEGQAYA